MQRLTCYKLTNKLKTLLVPKFLAFYLLYFLKYLCICIKYVHVHNGIIFQRSHWQVAPNASFWLKLELLGSSRSVFFNQFLQNLKLSIVQVKTPLCISTCLPFPSLTLCFLYGVLSVNSEVLISSLEITLYFYCTFDYEGIHLILIRWVWNNLGIRNTEFC